MPPCVVVDGPGFVSHKFNLYGKLKLRACNASNGVYRSVTSALQPDQGNAPARIHGGGPRLN
jgi:hypothetical protein